jgi:hypothetical protein
MADGSSSDAPVINPSPRERNVPGSRGLAYFASNRSSNTGSCFRRSVRGWVAIIGSLEGRTSIGLRAAGRGLPVIKNAYACSICAKAGQNGFQGEAQEVWLEVVACCTECTLILRLSANSRFRFCLYLLKPTLLSNFRNNPSGFCI